MVPPKHRSLQQQLHNDEAGAVAVLRKPHCIQNRRLQQRQKMSVGRYIWVVLIAAATMVNLDSGYSRRRSSLLSMSLCFVEAHDDNDGPLQPPHRPIVIEQTSLVYDPPFTEDRYFTVVASVLQAHRSVLEQDDHLSSEELEGLQNWDEAYWLFMLGKAHRNVLFVLTSKRALAALLGEATSQFDEDIEHHNKRSIGAHLRAISIYDDQLATERENDNMELQHEAKTPTQETILSWRFNRASACFSLAETLSMSSVTSKHLRMTSSSKTNTNNGEPVLSNLVYYQYAHDSLQEILSQYPKAEETMELGTSATKSHFMLVRREAELGWAHACSRLGELHLSNHNDLPMNSLTRPQRIEQAIAYFTNAADIFRQATNSGSDVMEWNSNDEYGTPRSSDQLTSCLAETLSRLGSARRAQGDLEDAIGHLEEAYRIYRSIVKPESKDKIIIFETVQAVSEVLLTLVDASLQLGRYQAAKVWYQKCMLWYERNGDKIIPRLDLFTGFRYDVDGSSAGLLSEYELLLKDYQESLFNDASGDMDDMPEMCEMAGQAEDYGRDNVYEADLHRNIGVLYLMIGSTHSIVPGGDNDIRSASHFKEAMRLYELTGESFAEGMGITKYTYSIYHLRNGNYRSSEMLYSEAIDIFRGVAEANGEDRPLMFGSTRQQQNLHNSVQSSSLTDRKQNVLTAADADSFSSSEAAGPQSKETKPITVQTGPAGHSKSSTILVDVQQFLKRNDSIKEEL